MKKKYFRKRIKLLILFVIVNAIIYSICSLSARISESQTSVRTVSNLSFNSKNDKPRTVFDNLPLFYKNFSIEFESDFLPSNDNYINIFQANNDPKTLRIELISPKSLQIVIGYKDDPGLKIYPISKKVRMNAWNHIKLSYSSNRNLYVKLNDEPGATFVDNKHDSVINDIVLGAGFDKQRIFVGQIKNAKFRIIFNETNILFFVPGLLSRYYLILIFFQLLFFYIKSKSWHNMEIKERDPHDVFTGFLTAFSFIAIIIILTGALSSPLTGQMKWIPFLALLIPSAAIGINYIKFLNNRYFTVIAGFLSFTILALGVLNYDRLSWFGISSVLIISCCFAVIPLMKYFSFISAGVFIFLYSINSVVFMNNYGAQNYIWTALITVIVVYGIIFSLSAQNRPLWNIRANKIGFAVLLIISSMLALRTDSLFLGSAEFHWNYYTGVIQTIRSGGELLWSAPSQYGFLNILLPSLMPWTSRNSFFIFQSVLFLIVTFIIIKTIYKGFKHTGAFILLSLTSLSLFYFADPSLIGPALFPSSSAVRFFWCYILIYVIVLEYKKYILLNGGVRWIVTIAYILGALWSAESLLYTTAIYVTYLIACTISISKQKKYSSFIFFFKNFSVIFLAWVATNMLYLVITDHFPDWSMYFMYAFNYAKGYGELAIKPWGIQWAVIIVLSGIIFISSRLYSAKKYNQWIVSMVCFISLWGLASYYVGRAVTNNLTALLPIIFYIFIVMSLILIDSKLFSYRLLLNSVFLPWIVVGVIGGIGNPQFIEKLQKFKYAEDINSKSFKPNRELSSILATLEISKGTRIIYYGDPYNNPVIPLKKGGYTDPIAGMPIPLTLLEEPISDDKKEIIMERFLNKLNEPVFLIHKENENMVRFINWKKFLEQKYFVENKKIGKAGYEVFLIRSK